MIFLFHFTLKKCSLLKIENYSSWVYFTHFQKKTLLLALELIFFLLKLAYLHVYKIWYLKWEVRMAPSQVELFSILFFKHVVEFSAFVGCVTRIVIGILRLFLILQECVKSLSKIIVYIRGAEPDTSQI